MHTFDFFIGIFIVVGMLYLVGRQIEELNKSTNTSNELLRAILAQQQDHSTNREQEIHISRAS